MVEHGEDSTERTRQQKSVEQAWVTRPTRGLALSPPPSTSASELMGQGPLLPRPAPLISHYPHHPPPVCLLFLLRALL